MLAGLAGLALLGACAPLGESGEDASGEAGPVPEASAPSLPLDAVSTLPRPEATGDAPDTRPDPDATSADAGPPVDRAELIARLDTLVDEAVTGLSDAELGVLVVDDGGRELASHLADRPLLPASTLKLVTAAAILTTLGPDARLRTTVETTAPIGEDGVLRGRLHLVGSGDPVLATAEYGRWVYPARPRTPLESLADDLVAAGLTRVTGDVMGYATGFAGPTTAEGWPESYFADFNARHIAGLTVDAGIDARIRWPDGEEPDPGDEETAPDRVILELAESPARQAAGQLIRLLEQRGVEVDGDARAGKPEHPAVGRLAQVESPPMEQLLRFMVQRSDNHLADTLLHVAGRARTGEGSFERGERAALQVLDHLGVDRADARLADGSGLSRDDRLTATTLVELDRAMSDGRHGAVWDSLMAVAGEQGTLSTRLRGTPAQGRLLAKTGHLRDVSALSGFVRDERDRRHHFAVLANDATGADRAVVRAFTDELALLLAADLLACAVEPGSGGGDGDDDVDEGPLGRPALEIAC